MKYILFFIGITTLIFVLTYFKWGNVLLLITFYLITFMWLLISAAIHNIFLLGYAMYVPGARGYQENRQPHLVKYVWQKKEWRAKENGTWKSGDFVTPFWKEYAFWCD